MFHHLKQVSFICRLDLIDDQSPKSIFLFDIHFLLFENIKHFCRFNFSGYTKSAIGSTRAIYHTFDNVTSSIPTGLGVTLNNICWNRFAYSFTMTLPTDTFLDGIYFTKTCPELLYLGTKNNIGKISVLNLIESFSLLEKSWYNSILSDMKKVMPNSKHSQIIPNEENLNFLNTFDSKITNSEKHIKNYNQILGKTTDDFNLFKTDLVGLNKSCFMSDTVYQDIFGLGLLKTIYTIEEYSIGSAGISKKQASKILERKLTKNKHSTTGNYKRIRASENLLGNSEPSSKNTNLKYSKTSKSITSLSDLHNLASLTFQNLYSVQSQNDKVFIALVILSSLGIFTLALAEYNYRIVRDNKYSKVCLTVMMTLLFIGVLICLIIIIISQAAVSNVLSKVKEFSCIDASLILKMEADLLIVDLLIPICVGFGILVFTSILGVSLSCYLCKQRPKYKLASVRKGLFL